MIESEPRLYTLNDVKELKKNEIRLNNNNNIGKNSKLNQAIILLKYFLDYILSGFVFGPIAILYWTCTWDFFYYYIVPDDRLLNPIATALIGQFLIFLTYIFQDQLQNYQDYHYASIDSENERKFYPKGFLLRAIYAYVLSVGYIAQWTGLWDLYGYYIEQVYFLYGTGIAIIGIILQWAVLKRSLYSYATTVPFCLYPDVENERFFIKNTTIRVKNVSLIFRIFFFTP